MIDHPFEPIYNINSKIIILGTMPSVASRKDNFYYGHPQNRFWRILAALTGSFVPKTTYEKKKLLLDKGIALWDVLKSCEIDMSKDSSITNPEPNNFDSLFKDCNIRAVFTNGKKAEELYRKLCFKKTNVRSINLPSTSPANASYSFERLLKHWSIILEHLS